MRKKARWLDFRCGRQKVAIVKQPLLDGETIEKRIRSAGDDNSFFGKIAELAGSAAGSFAPGSSARAFRNCTIVRSVRWIAHRERASPLPIVRMYPNVRRDLASLGQPDHVHGPRSARPAFQRAGFSVAEVPRGVPLTPVCRARVTTCAPFKCKHRGSNSDSGSPMATAKVRASTILGEFEQAQTELVGKAVILTDGERPVRWRAFGLTKCTACESLSEATMGSGPSPPSNSRSRAEIDFRLRCPA